MTGSLEAREGIGLMSNSADKNRREFSKLTGTSLSSSTYRVLVTSASILVPLPRSLHLTGLLAAIPRVGITGLC